MKNFHKVFFVAAILIQSLLPLATAGSNYCTKSRRVSQSTSYTQKCGSAWRRRRRCTHYRQTYTTGYYQECCDGWLGNRCDIPDCSRCVNAYCTRPNICICNPGWSGDRCTSPICASRCFHGTCAAPNTCRCDSGWGGSTCDTPICTHSCIHGTCEGPNTCSCTEGYTGGTCHTPICTVPCDQGTCVAPDTCQCSPGWTGSACEAAICDSPCQHGSCVAPNTCNCDAGWSGRTCDTPICKPACQNGGVCQAPNDCDCPSRFNDGDQCELEVCSALNDCYPGSCQEGTLHCVCNSGFSGENCEIVSSEPTFKDCEGLIRLEEGGETEVLVLQECPYKGLGKVVVYSKDKKFSHVEFKTKIYFEDIPRTVIDPAFLKNYAFGVIESEGYIRIRDSDGTILRQEMEACVPLASPVDPETNEVTCNHIIDLTHDITHRQRIDIDISAWTGGSKLIDVDGTDTRRVYTGMNASTKISVMFDLQRPQHCTEMNATCDSQEPAIVTVGPDVVKDSNINISFYEWMDTDSGIDSYRVHIYELEFSDNTGFLEQNRHPIASYNFTNKNVYRTRLPHPGYFAVNGEIYDSVGNLAKVRSTILYHNQPKIQQTSAPIKVEGSQNVNGMFWFSNVHVNILKISWHGRYENTFLKDNNYLEPLADFNGDLDDDTGKLGIHGLPSANGITRFSYIFTDNIDMKRQKRKVVNDDYWTDVNPFGESCELRLPNTMTDNDTYTVILRAEDVFGNTVTDYIYVRMDSDPPVLTNGGNVTFVKNVNINAPGYFSSINIPVADYNSGIQRIDYTFYDGDFDEIIIHETQIGQVSGIDSCETDPSCYCTYAQHLGECFESVQTVYIDNCKLAKYLQSEIIFNASVFNMALTSADVRLDIEPLRTLDGIDTYPPLRGLRMDISPGVSPVVEWSLPVACYEPEFVRLNILTNEEDTEILVPAYVGEVPLSDLHAKTEYTVIARIRYTTGHESSELSTGFLTVDNTSGLPPGGIAGIVLIVLIVVGVIVAAVIVVLIKQRRIIVKKPQDDPLTHLRHELARSNVEAHKNPVYGTNVADPDETYVADGDLTEMRHNASQVEIGDLIKVGKFAQINKGFLNKVEVAVKVAKNPTEENNRILISKMNYLTNTVHRHPNLLNVVERFENGPTGPMMLLELCDDILLDWLKAITKVDTSVLDDLLNISVQCARGLESLHKQKIVHRRLGARNVFLRHEQRGIVAKLAGLCPPAALNEDTVPMKWLALEQIGLAKGKKRVYNRRSDIWAFGVLLWEIFAKGAAPYSEIATKDIKQALERGTRLECPDDCPQEWFDDLMKPCWKSSSTSRPTSSALLSKLDNLMTGGPGEGYYGDDQIHDQGMDQYVNT